MTLARRAQAHDKAQGARRKIALVRMRHNRWIEQSCRFKGILAGKHRADQQLSLQRQLALREHMAFDHLKMIQHHFLDIEVTRAKFFPNDLQLVLNFLIAQQQGATNDRGDAVFFERNERSDDHPRTFGMQNDVVATENQRLHQDA